MNEQIETDTRWGPAEKRLDDALADRTWAADFDAAGQITPAVETLMRDTAVLWRPVPTSLGGQGLDLTGQLGILERTATCSGSFSWLLSIYFTGFWLASTGWPDRVASACRSRDPISDLPPVFATSLSPLGTLARAEDDTLCLTGNWRYSTGSAWADWNVLGAWSPEPAKEHVAVLVPTSTLAASGRWATIGLRGADSAGVTVDGHRLTDTETVPLSRMAEASPPMYPLFAVYNCGTSLGLAERALSEFRTEASSRRVPYTGYPCAAEAPFVQRRVAEATMLLGAARALAYGLAAEVGSADRRTTWSLADRARARSTAATVTSLCLRAVETCVASAGSSGFRQDSVLSAVALDLRVVAQHAALNVDTAYEAHGRVLLGLDSATTFI